MPANRFLTCLTCLLPWALPAAELVVRDVRAAVLVRSSSFEFELDSPTFDRSGDDSFDSGTGIEVGARYSIAPTGSSWGLVFGGDVTADWYTYDGGDGLAMYGLRAAGGGGWALADRWTLVSELGVGYAFSEMTLPATNAAAEYTADGTSLFYDARLSCLFRVHERWSVHAHVGYMIASHDLDGSGVNITIDQDGIWAGIGFTWLFSNKPTRLE